MVYVIYKNKLTKNIFIASENVWIYIIFDNENIFQ